MNYKCMDDDELQDNTCKGVCRILLSAPVRLLVILILGEALISAVFKLAGVAVPEFCLSLFLIGFICLSCLD